MAYKWSEESVEFNETPTCILRTYGNINVSISKLPKNSWVYYWIAQPESTSINLQDKEDAYKLGHKGLSRADGSGSLSFRVERPYGYIGDHVEVKELYNHQRVFNDDANNEMVNYAGPHVHYQVLDNNMLSKTHTIKMTYMNDYKVSHE